MGGPDNSSSQILGSGSGGPTGIHRHSPFLAEQSAERGPLGAKPTDLGQRFGAVQEHSSVTTWLEPKQLSHNSFLLAPLLRLATE